MGMMHARWSKELRRKFRKNMTWSEKLFWMEVQERRNIIGKIRRQIAIGRFIVDFLHGRSKLAIEIDGSIHFNKEARARDSLRTNWLLNQGFDVIRFTNDEVQSNIELVFQKLQIRIKNRLVLLTSIRSSRTQPPQS